MRYGVLADIHGNLPALEAAISVLTQVGVDGYIVAGDLVGYGPFPNECVAVIAELDPVVCVAGNHDLIALGQLSSDRCIELARKSLEWTRSVLDADARAFLASLPLVAGPIDGVVVAHGTLEDPEVYTVKPSQASRQLEQLAARHPEARVLIVGHTHRPWGCGENGVVLRPRGDVLVLPPRTRVLLNPGAVGQSRERRVRSRFLVLDSSTATYYAVRYETDRCKRALRAQGLPPRSYHLRRSLSRRIGVEIRRAQRRAAGLVRRDSV